MAVTGLEISGRTILADGTPFGLVGPYEQVTGIARFAFDPAHPRNTVITDLGLAPRGADGLVHFDADFAVIRPVAPRRGNRRLVYDVLNRGNKLALRMFNEASGPDTDGGPDAGNGFLMRQGYTLAWCGWQHDVPAGRLACRVPQAIQDGRPLCGRILVEIQVNQPVRSAQLSDRGCIPNPALDVDEPGATLSVRSSVFGERRIVPRDRWRFARDEGGAPATDPTSVYLEDGFEPGLIYEAVYEIEGAPVIGLGLAGARDFVSFLRYAGEAEGNPCAENFDWAYGFGASQSGLFLREFLYLGMNEDERDRMVFDGLIPHIAGHARGQFNHRFGQPSYVPAWGRGVGSFPFSDTTQEDQKTGVRDGLLARLEARGKAPKIFHVNSGVEYWVAGASLIHTDPAGLRDAPIPEDVRCYLMASTQHGAGTLPLTDSSPLDGARVQQPFNSVNYTPLLRAALINLDAWASRDLEPPTSQIPRLSEGTAVPPRSLAATFTAIPGVNFPAEPLRVYGVDYGAGGREGRLDLLPPRLAGEPYPILVSAVDGDGNDLTGIRLPEVAVPLATYTGWNLRHPDTGAPGMMPTTSGATIPFARTAAERQATGDPRPSMAERYASKEAYIEKVKRVVAELVKAGFLLIEDAQDVIAQGDRRYDLLTAPAARE